MEEAASLLARQVQNQETPSVHYLIFDREQVIDRFILGQAQIANGIQADTATTYKAFSVTKTFTALAVLQLAEQHELELNLPVKKYLPDFSYSSDITVKQLLSHTAGIPNPIPLSWIHLAAEHQQFNSRHFFNLIFAKQTKLRSRSGLKFAYSNLGYVLLGQLIERLSGSTYEDNIHQNIISKLNLRPGEMSFHVEDAVNHAKGYHRIMSLSYAILGFLMDKEKYMDKTEGKWKSFKDCYVNGASYGGLIGTPDAFMKCLQELLKPDNTLIGEEFKRLLFTETFTAGHVATGMCLSWFKGNLHGREYFAHAGGGGGYYCEIRIYPAQGIGSVIFYNRTGLKDERMLDKLDGFYMR